MLPLGLGPFACQATKLSQPLGCWPSTPFSKSSENITSPPLDELELDELLDELELDELLDEDEELELDELEDEELDELLLELDDELEDELDDELEDELDDELEDELEDEPPPMTPKGSG